MNDAGGFVGIVQLVGVIGMVDREDAALYHALLSPSLAFQNLVLNNNRTPPNVAFVTPIPRGIRLA